jgi:hypothetical protein
MMIFTSILLSRVSTMHELKKQRIYKPTTQKARGNKPTIETVTITPLLQAQWMRGMHKDFNHQEQIVKFA